jgi:cardiolipin synthase
MSPSTRIRRSEPLRPASVPRGAKLLRYASVPEGCTVVEVRSGDALGTIAARLTPRRSISELLEANPRLVARPPGDGSRIYPGDQLLVPVQRAGARRATRASRATRANPERTPAAPSVALQPPTATSGRRAAAASTRAASVDASWSPPAQPRGRPPATVSAARAGALTRAAMTADAVFAGLNTLNEAIAAELKSSGVFGQGLEPWQERSDRLAGLVQASAAPAGGGVDTPQFKAEFERLTGSRFSAGNTVKLLADGPAAWDRRVELISSAKSDIKLTTWAFCDDDTGVETARLLIAKASEGVRVSVVVDGDTTAKPGYRMAVAMLEKAAAEGLPVSVNRWENPDVPGQGQHQKYLVIDHGKVAISGGRNPGDAYYQLGQAKAAWTDTEIELTGPAAGALNKSFVADWNRQAEFKRQEPEPVGFNERGSLEGFTEPARTVLPALPDKTSTARASGAVQTAVVEHSPGTRESNITAGTLLAIRGAKERFWMTNAYFLALPAVREELKAAVKRGVDVRLLTNSAESLDEPALSAPILAAVAELAAAGVKVFLQKNTQTGLAGENTVHSKYWVADGQLSSVQSHNEHPRSEYYERELAVVSQSGRSAKELAQEFSASTQAGRARAITDPSQVTLELGTIDKLRSAIFNKLLHRQS